MGAFILRLATTTSSTGRRSGYELPIAVIRRRDELVGPDPEPTTGSI